MYTYKAICTNVVDGDTMDFDVDLGFHMTAGIRVRLADIDTPEIRGEEKVEGKLVKEFVHKKLFLQEVMLSTEKTGSFGRWIGIVIMSDGESISDKIRREFPEVK